MEFKFGSNSIIELGGVVSNALKENGVVNKAELTICLNADEFRKVDEDLFYRNKKDSEQEFIPSDEEIDVNFELVKIIIKQENNYGCNKN